MTTAGVTDSSPSDRDVVYVGYRHQGRAIVKTDREQSTLFADTAEDRQTLGGATAAVRCLFEEQPSVFRRNPQRLTVLACEIQRFYSAV